MGSSFLVVASVAIFLTPALGAGWRSQRQVPLTPRRVVGPFTAREFDVFLASRPVAYLLQPKPNPTRVQVAFDDYTMRIADVALDTRFTYAHRDINIEWLIRDWVKQSYLAVQHDFRSLQSRISLWPHLKHITL